MSINKIVKKEKVFSMCASNGFHFMCIDMTNVSMIRKDLLHLTTMVPKCYQISFVNI